MWFVIGGGAIVEIMGNEHWQCHKIRVRPLAPIHGQFRFYLKSILIFLYVFSAVASSGVGFLRKFCKHVGSLSIFLEKKSCICNVVALVRFFQPMWKNNVHVCFSDVCVIMFARHVWTIWLGSHGCCMFDPFFVTIVFFGVVSVQCIVFLFMYQSVWIILFDLFFFWIFELWFFIFQLWFVFFFSVVLCIHGFSFMYFCILAGWFSGFSITWFIDDFCFCLSNVCL